jgi:hypothetical protein
MRLLVFCGTRAAIERFDMLPDWQVIVAIYPTEQKKEMLKAFWKNPDAKLAVDHSMILGWNFPADTIPLFDASWRYAPDAPESIQAVARVRRLPPGL